MIIGILYVLISIGVFIGAWREFSSFSAYNTTFDDFMDFVVAVIAGIFWPAFIVFGLILAPFYLVFVSLRPLVLGKKRNDV
jgi:hypothetical protein